MQITIDLTDKDVNTLLQLDIVSLINRTVRTLDQSGRTQFASEWDKVKPAMSDLLAQVRMLAFEERKKGLRVVHTDRRPRK